MKRAHRTSGGVTVQVKGKGVTVTPHLHEEVARKMERLDKYLDRLQTIQVELVHEKTRDADHQNHVEATAHVPGQTLHVTTTNADMVAAIDEAVDRLYRQLNRKKERMKGHHAPKPAELLLAEEEPVDSPVEPTEPVMHVERLAVKPQFEDEAIEELEAQSRPFYVFLNARNEQLNVLYRRVDGSYALIEPRTD